MTLAFSLLRCYTALNALQKGGYTCDGLERLRFLQKRKPLSFSGSKCTLLYQRESLWRAGLAGAGLAVLGVLVALTGAAALGRKTRVS